MVYNHNLSLKCYVPSHGFWSTEVLSNDKFHDQISWLDHGCSIVGQTPRNQVVGLHAND